MSPRPRHAVAGRWWKEKGSLLASVLGAAVVLFLSILFETLFAGVRGYAGLRRAGRVIERGLGKGCRLA